MTEMEIQALERNHKEYVSKDKMAQICKISKRTCLYLLESGAVPCVDTKRKTHRFYIHISEVKAFLRDREIDPQKYRAPEGYYRKKRDPRVAPYYKMTEEDLQRMRSFYEDLLKDQPEVLTIEDVCAFTEYSYNMVRFWCYKKKVECFLVSQKYYIPKEYLIDFFLTPYFINKAEKNDWHREMMAEFFHPKE